MTQITKSGTNPLATSGARAAATFADNMDMSDFKLPVIALFHDTAEEKQQHGEHKWGTWINTMTAEGFDGGIVPFRVEKAVVVWKKGQSWPEATFDRTSDVPDEFYKDGYSIEETLTWYVIADGIDLPCVIRFKRTGYNAGKTLNTMEAARAAAGKPRGLYNLSSQDATSADGKPYKKPLVKPAGDASEEQMALCDGFLPLVTSGAAVAHDEAEPADNGAPTNLDDDNIPF